MIETLESCKASKFEHQVAGHTSKMVRRYGERCIIKPQIKPDLFQREVQFYEEIFKSRKSAPAFIPRYHGLVEVEEEEAGTESITPLSKRPYIILEDFTLNYVQPSMIDIKIGQQTFEPTASKEKIARELKKYPHQQDIGFRITGMKVWDSTFRQYRSFDKWFGRSLEPSHVIFGLAYYFFNGETFNIRVLEDSIRSLQNIVSWMQSQTRYKFFCSSILVVYDSDRQTPNSTEEVLASESTPACRVGMIDFAHVCINDPDVTEIDEGYIFGVTNLITNLQFILDLVNTDPCADFVREMQLFIAQWKREVVVN